MPVNGAIQKHTNASTSTHDSILKARLFPATATESLHNRQTVVIY